jgi:ubiquinone/menaquinone biosynthesis C-methylase UbiE
MSSDYDLGGAVPPWGRSAAEYEGFFALSDIPPCTRILDCGAGPASFAAEWSRKGHFVVAADPIYRLPGREIAADFEPTAERILEGTRRARDRFRWDYYGSPEAVVERRRNVLAAFIDDFQASAPAGRYISGRLPDLPFQSRFFDLVLCSHLLFLYSSELGLDMHVASLQEMLRVGREVRVFPLLDMDGQPSLHLNACIRVLEASAHVEFIPVPFEFRHGDSKMLRLTPHVLAEQKRIQRC